MNDSIEIRGAKEHNLKNISLSIPHKTLTTLTGVSGSGKSSLAFDTIFKEGQRRYLESLSAYARQFLGVMAKADVEHIEGLSPTISIDQKSVNKNPRSTVGTVTEIYDFFRLLFARLGTPYCSKCGHKISKQSEDQIAQTILRDFKDKRLLILAPIVRDRKGEYRKEIEEVKNAGYQRIRIDNIVYKFEDDIIPELKRYEKHTLEIVIDRIKAEDKYLSRITDDIERAIRITKGLVAFYEEHEIIEEENSTEEKTKRKKTKISKQSEIDKYYRLYTTERSCANCGHSIADIEPNLFSFNNPMGACSICGGLGVEHIFTEKHIIKDENLNIYEGALSCFVDNHIGFDMEYGFEELEIIAKIYNINLKKAWKDLSKNEKKYLLYGSDKEVKWKKRFWYHSKIVEEKIPGILTRLKYDYETYKISYYANFMDEVECPKCKGKRINEDALAVKFDGKTIADFSSMTIEDLFNYFSKLKLKPNEEIIGKPIIKEIIYRLTFLVKVGLTYLTIERASPTLSGGESQRIRLASQIGSGLEGVLYVLDEPSIGLHQSDNKKLIESLKTLRDKNNTVIVVEHDKETMEESDYLIDIGLDAGVSGGNIVGIGNFNEFIKSEKSYTAKYLRGDDNIPIPKNRREGNGKFLKIIGASQFNLKNIDVKIPLGLFLVVSGLSGSGKSTLIDNILMRALHNHFYGKTFNVGKHKKIEGFENIDKVIEVDQSPIGRTPRSNPATYTKVLSPIRDLFAATKLSKMRGYDKGRFSFNVKTGRCPTCEGAGLIELEMQFLSNVLVPCEECAGKRFNAETLDIKYKNKNGMEKQVGKSDIFTKKSLIKLQDKMRTLCIEEFNQVYSLDSTLKTKQKGRNRDIHVSDMDNYIELKKQIEKNTENLKQAKKKNLELKQDSKDIEDKIDKLKVSKLNKDNYILSKDDKDSFINFIKQVDNTNDEYAKIQTLSNTLINANEELKNKDKQIKTLSENNKALNLRVDTLNNTIKEKDNEISFLKSKINDFKDALEYWKDKFEKLISFLHNKLHSWYDKDDKYIDIVNDMYEDNALDDDDIKELDLNKEKDVFEK